MSEKEEIILLIFFITCAFFMFVLLPVGLYSYIVSKYIALGQFLLPLP